MTLQERRRVLVPMLLASALLLAGCSGGGSHHRNKHKGGGGPLTFFEFEPNDAPSEANFVGSIAIGDYYRIRGHIADWGPDVFDGFAFYTLEPLDVEFILSVDDPFADLDTCLYEPFFGANTICWESAFNPELGLFGMNGGEDFHLVVASFFGSSTYTLEVLGHPIGFLAATKQAPAESALDEGPESGAKGPRPRPMSEYFEPAETQAASEEEPLPVLEGRLIEVGPGGEVRSRPIEASEQGIRIGPVSFDLGIGP